MFSKFRSLIFKFDPEVAHDLAIKSLKFNILSKTSYGLEFTSSLFKNNIVAVQLHPEKRTTFYEMIV